MLEFYKKEEGPCPLYTDWNAKIEACRVVLKTTGPGSHVKTKADALILKQTYRRPRPKHLAQEEQVCQQRLQEGRLRSPVACSSKFRTRIKRWVVRRPKLERKLLLSEHEHLALAVPCSLDFLKAALL